MIGALHLLAISVATSLTCYSVPDGYVTVDGILDDWDQVPLEVLDGQDIVRGADMARGKYDFSVQVGCVYTPNGGIHFLVKVTDSVTVRNRRAGKKDDRVELVVGEGRKARRLLFFPKGDGQRAVVRVPRKVRAKVVALSLGYAVEVGIPWGVGGLFASMPKFPVALVVYDVDSHLKMRPETIAALDGRLPPKRGSVVPEGMKKLLDSAMDRLGISAIRRDMVGNFVEGPKQERMVWGDQFLVLMGGDLGLNFLYIRLANSPTDVLEFRTLDLDGDGVQEVLTEVSFASGKMTAVVVWKGTPRGVKRMFAHLLEFHDGPHYIVNTYKLKAVGRGKRRHYKMIFRFSKASPSITRKNWKGAPPDDTTVDFLFPWTAHKEVFVFSGGTVYGGR